MKTDWFLGFPHWLHDVGSWSGILIGLYAAIKARSAKKAVNVLLSSALVASEPVPPAAPVVVDPVPPIVAAK